MIFLLLTFWLHYHELTAAPKNIPPPAITPIPNTQPSAESSESQPQTVLHDTEAMRLLYQNFDETTQVSHWKAGNASILLFQAFEEDGQKKWWLVTSTLPASEEEGEYHAQAVTIGSAIFINQNDTWKIESKNLNISAQGSWGHTEAPEIIQIGKTKKALLFEGGGSGQGITSTTYSIVIPIGNSLKEVLLFRQASEDNGGACGEEDKNCYYNYATKLEWIPNPTQDYYDLKTITEGTDKVWEPSEKIIPIKKIRCFSLKGSHYVQTCGDPIPRY